jgi:N utilization substance protein A
MTGTAEILSAIRELSHLKQLDRTELHGLLQDGIHAALAKKHGPNVKAEVEIDEVRGDIRIVLLKTVVEEVVDPAAEVSLEEARFEDDEFQPGDVMEIPVDFAEFGRSAVQAAKQRIIQRVREGERTRIRDEFSSRVGELLSGEVQQIERGKLVLMLAKFREAEAIMPYREQNHREHFHQGDPIRAVLKRVEETPKGPRLILTRADPVFVKALFKLEVPEIQQGIVEIRAAAREVGSRTKIAVWSRDESIDPVGACVGLKGSRVRPWSTSSMVSGSTSSPGQTIRSASPSWRWRRRGWRVSSPIPSSARSRRWWTKTSCRLRSAATGRTSVWRRSSQDGKSTCTPVVSGWSAAKRRFSSRCLTSRMLPQTSS